MTHFSIRGRLILLATTLLVILAAALILLTRELARDSQTLADEAELVSVVRSAANASKHFGDLKFFLTDFAVTQNPTSQQKAEAAKDQLGEDLKIIRPVDAEGVTAIERDVNTLWELVQKASDAYFSNDDSVGGNALMAQAQSRILSANNEIEEIVDRIEREDFSRRDASVRDARQTVDVSIIAGILALAVALGATALIVRSINAPLRPLEHSIDAITQG